MSSVKQEHRGRYITRELTFRDRMVYLNKQYDIYLFLTWLISIVLATKDQSIALNVEVSPWVPVTYKNWLLYDGLGTIGLAVYSLVFLILCNQSSCSKVWITIKVLLALCKVAWVVIGLRIMFDLQQINMTVFFQIFSLIYFIVFIIIVQMMLRELCEYAGNCSGSQHNHQNRYDSREIPQGMSKQYRQQNNQGDNNHQGLSFEVKGREGIPRHQHEQDYSSKPLKRMQMDDPPKEKMQDRNTKNEEEHLKSSTYKHQRAPIFSPEGKQSRSPSYLQNNPSKMMSNPSNKNRQKNGGSFKY